jgi:D-tyrosyl-tRNA(Tyr) deacylase
MRALIQRVARAKVTVEGAVTGEITGGLLVLLGVASHDTADIAQRLAEKTVNLRIFEDVTGHMNRSLVEIGGRLLCVSQFTLYGDTRRGRRPSFAAAAPPDLARERYDQFCAAVQGLGIECQRGVFGAHMAVELVNDGPVTLMLDSDDFERPRRA